ncbi:MAG: EAL domain-containing protein [Colwellia sp.]|nr:EAL domain-containing protein [Colwellia sp.]
MSMNILIVDDDQVDRTHIKRMMRRIDSSNIITEAEDADSALVLLVEQNFDIVLLDYTMPQKNGLELLKEIQDQDIKKHSAIIMMSTSEQEELALSCLKAGAHDFIIKSDITGYRLRRAILAAQARFDMETKLKESYDKVKQLAEQDCLTKLANRYFFDESLKVTISNNERQPHKTALLLFDLDHFKYVNDTHGHDVGDLLLQKVVHRIHTCLRGNEVFSRLGGDEFAIILNHVDRVGDAEKVALRILKVLIKPFCINGAEINMAASIGISFYPDNANSASDLFKKADIAMYKAKHLGRNQIAFFEDEMQQQFLNRYRIENNLKQALYKQQFELFYQPVFNCADSSIIGFEALLRWHSNDGLISPEVFIPIAEESRLIKPIGRWVISQACQQISLWQAHCPSLTMAINLSPVQLLDNLLLSHIKKCFKTYDINPQTIEFEITETALLDDSWQTQAVIKNLSELGCKIALDDFGTGFSSLSHLHHFPINTVKIDKSLMPVNEVDFSNEKLIHGLVIMLQYLNLNIVAEGVEFQSQLALCQSLHIQKLQGYLLSKPIPPDEINKFSLFANYPKITPCVVRQ